MHNPIDQRSSVSADRLRRLPTEISPPYNWQEFQRRARLRLPVTRRRLDLGLAAAAAIAVLCIGGVAIWSRGGFVGQRAIDSNTVANTDASGRAATVHRSNRMTSGVVSEGVGSDPASSRAASNGMTSGSASNGLASDDMTGPASNGAPNTPASTTNDNFKANAASRSRALLASSRAVENWLASLPQEPVLVRVGTRSAVAGLEDRIAQVDDMLTSGRLEGTHPERLVALQQERVQLVGSLAQVRYAEVVAAQSP